MIVVSRALKRQTNVLLLLDEFQKWLSRLKVDERANLLGIFRGLRNRPGDEIITFSVVLAGLSNLREYANASLDFKAAFDIYDLRPFNATETESLIRSNETIEFDRRAVERIRQLSGGNPFLINLLGNDIAEVLRSSGRGYCLPEDVQVAVRRQLDLGEDSRVWRYLEYLLRKDEEDTGARIAEFPAVVALARTVHSRAILRTHVSLDEISAELASDSIEFDRVALQHQLKEAEKNELVERSGDRYCLASGWLGEWLAKRPLVPVKVAEDPDLVLNRYKIVGHRKGGGQASVYDAVDTMLTDRRVVLKIYSAPEGQSRSFEREVKALCTLRHPNIVECLTYGFDEKRGGVLVLGPVNGEPLAEMIDRHSATAESLIGARGDLSLQVKFIEALADALNACHSAGVIHKDVSAGNVIVYGKDGLWHPVLIDFGIASRTEEARIFATTGAYTPGYVAPERHTGQPRRAPGDVYCLGVIGYELLTGRNPFPSDPVAAAQMQRVEDFTPIADLRPELPIPLAELIERMLKADPAERPDALTVAKSLRASLQPLEWNDYLAAGREAYTAGASKRAYDSFEVAMISAPEGVLQSQEYLEGLEDFVAVAKHEGKLLGIGVSLVDRLCWATNGCDSNQCAKLAQLILKELVDTPAQNQDAKTQLSGCLARLAEIVWNNGPIPAISTSLPMVLEHLARPAVWDRRHDLFLIAHEHTLAKMFPEETLGHWCVRVSRLVRERGQAASESQLWLQRAGNLGMCANPDYVAEQKALAAALPANDSARLPEPAAKQDPASDILGTDEQGHFNGERMTRWASRLLRCYPWVSTVRRLKGDGTLEKYPTRMLDLNEVPRHASPFPALDPNRLIPAVLDASFAKPANSRVVRINIVLSEGTTAAQREAAIASLRHDAYLFPEG